MRGITSSRPLVALAILVAPALSAQDGSLRVTVPSPTAASLGKFGDVPVSLTTGVPDISIPLFTAKGKTLEHVDQRGPDSALSEPQDRSDGRWVHQRI